MDDEISDSDCETDSGPSKRMKASGKAGAVVYQTKFNRAWTLRERYQA